MPDQTTELDELKHRIARLEAKEAIISTLNRYLYSLDTGFGDDIVDCYTDDAVLDVPNFPGAGGDDLHFEGKAQIAVLFEPYGDREPGIGTGHHSANLAINVAADLETADVSAYFMTSTPQGVQGGRYEGSMRACEDGVWRWQRLSITSAWGWTAKEVEVVSEPVGINYSPFGGKAVRYQPNG